MAAIISILKLSKMYPGGHQALNNINLDIQRGEILALLGPNGAGKTTLISIICGIVNATSGKVSVDGHDIVTDYRFTRSIIGLVPQELTLGMFDTIWNTVCFSRGLFGKKPDKRYLEGLLSDLSLLDKKNCQIMTLSGGMKRRVLIAKALSHEPAILFLDEPTAGVDVKLRKDMWNIIETLRASGVTIILTTHYIEEAEAIADRVGVINKGELLVIDKKTSLMDRLGKRQLIIHLEESIDFIPKLLDMWGLKISISGNCIIYTYDAYSDRTGIAELLKAIGESHLKLKDIESSESSLEDIFMDLVEA